MVEYTLKDVGHSIGPIENIPGCPIFISLWQLRSQLIAGTKRIKNDDHPLNVYSGYIMYQPEYALLSTKEWIDAPDVGAFFDIPASAFTDTKQCIAKKRWKTEKDRRDMLDNVETNLITILENDIEKLYHTGGTIMGATGFGTITAPQIIARLQQNYGKPVIGDIKKSLFRLNDTMDRNMPIEVMLRSLKEVQMFLLESSKENR